MTIQEAFSRYAAHSPLEPAPEAVEQELELLILEEKQRMQYETLTGAAIHLQPQLELEEAMDELRRQAQRLAREALVLRTLLAEQEFTITPQELEAEAEALAQRRSTTVEELRRFLGQELSLLRRDLLERKAMTWAVECEADPNDN